MNPARFTLRTSRSGLSAKGGANRLLASQKFLLTRRTFAADQQPYDPTPKPHFETRTPPPPNGPAASGPTFGSHYNPPFSSFGSDGPPPPNVKHDPTILDEPRSKIGPWLTALLIAGIGITAYGVGEIYGSLTIWPKELRGDLRQGLKETLKGDKSMAERYLLRAWQTAKSLPISKFGTKESEGPYLKTTGVAIALAGLYEEDGKLQEAYDTYKDALHHLQMQNLSAGVGGSGPVVGVDEEPAPGTVGKGARIGSGKASPTPVTDSEASARLLPNLNPQERMRAVAISYKLAELAEQMNLPKDEEEKWLVWSVETVLRDVMSSPVVAEVVVKAKNQETGAEAEDARGVVESLNLPSWAVNHDLAAPFEALGTFYSKEGKISYAMPLYLQAIAILIPPPPQISSADDQCRAAQLMGNISELIVRSSSSNANQPSTETLVQAESWAQKGLEVATRARKSTFVKHSACEVAYAFGLFNLGVLREMSGDDTKARQLFTESLDQSRSIGFEEGIMNAEAATRGVGDHAHTGSGAV